MPLPLLNEARVSPKNASAKCANAYGVRRCYACPMDAYSWVHWIALSSLPLSLLFENLSAVLSKLSYPMHCKTFSDSATTSKQASARKGERERERAKLRHNERSICSELDCLLHPRPLRLSVSQRPRELADSIRLSNLHESDDVAVVVVVGRHGHSGDTHGHTFGHCFPLPETRKHKHVSYRFQ